MEKAKAYRCGAGHVMRGANVGIRPGGAQAGQRYCKKCQRDRAATYARKRRGKR
jgi:hypothetical protein